MKPSVKIMLLAVTLACAAPLAASAATYYTADFTLGSFSSPNIKAPFIGVVPPSSTFSGKLVFDQDLIPGPGTGYQNVFFSSFPDIALIPDATALSFNIGSLAFDLGDALTPPFGTQAAAIQYRNGNFNGLFYTSDFSYGGGDYELQIQGGALNIYGFTGGFVDLSKLVVSGYVDLRLANAQPFTPGSTNPGGPTGVPEPASLALLLAGLGGLGFAARRKSAAKA